MAQTSRLADSGFGVRRRTSGAGARVIAALLAVLAASPVTAPFPTCRLSALLWHGPQVATTRTGGAAVGAIADVRPAENVLSMVTEEKSTGDAPPQKSRLVSHAPGVVQSLAPGPINLNTTRTVGAVLRL